MAPLCQACSQLKLKRSDFTSPPFEPDGRYGSEALAGTFGALRSSRTACGLCELIWNAMEQSDGEALSLAKDGDQWNLVWSQNSFDFEPDYDVENAENLFGSALYPRFGIDENRGDYGIQLIDHYETDGFLRGRLVPDSIDPETIEKWISRCRSLHGQICASSFFEARLLSGTARADLTVVDVEDFCLCKLPSGAMYSALSYVWGDRNRPVSLVSNQSAFWKPNGLNIDLPQTVQDAIDVTKAVGIRFAWIDSLCIVQDDLETKQVLINNMDSIYFSAEMTLVAATGSGATAGLSGWSNKEGRKQTTCELSEDFRLGIIPYYQRRLLECHHVRRAWTFQETCLSPRCLIFLQGYIYFNCNAAVYAEHTNAEVDGIIAETSANSLGKTYLHGSELRMYSQHVSSYCSRSLTYQSDAVNAFIGIANAISNAMFVKEMRCGMPFSCFDWALQWDGYGSLSRREGLPSWSWIGWVGNIQMPNSIFGNYEQRWLLKGTWINWYTVKSTGRFGPIWDTDEGGYILSPMVQEVLNEASSITDAASIDISTQNERSQTPAESGDSNDSHTSEIDEPIHGPCPTYGPSTPHNPFGRIIPQEAMNLLSSPPPLSPSTIISPSPSSSAQDPNHLLLFSAPTLTLQVEGTSLAKPSRAGRTSSAIFWPSSSSSPPSNAANEEKDEGESPPKICGYLSINNPHLWPTSAKGQMKLCILSVRLYTDRRVDWLDGDLGRISKEMGKEEREGEGDDSDLFPDDEVPEDLEGLDYLTVLAVRESGREVEAEEEGKRRKMRVHERVGIGVLYRPVLGDAEVKWEEVMLG